MRISTYLCYSDARTGAQTAWSKNEYGILYTMTPKPSIAITTTSSQLQDVVNEYALRLQLPVVDPQDTQHDYLLQYIAIDEAPGYRVELQQTSQETGGPIVVDFLGGKLGHRRKYGGGRNQELARAVGMKPGINPNVIDATAGLGRDGFILASLGCKVTLLERSPIIHALLENGLARAMNDPDSLEVTSRIRLICCDASTYLQQLQPLEYPDTIYLDPMYPHREKSALVKKEMRYFRAIVGDDTDAGKLLSIAMHRARKRIVVKRPKGASPISEPVHASISSKNTRYDLYTPVK